MHKRSKSQLAKMDAPNMFSIGSMTGRHTL